MQPDVLPARQSELLGGPLGRFTDPNGRWRAVVARIVPLVWVPMILAVLQRERCVRFGWGGQDQFWRACFSDLPAQYSLGNLTAGFGGYLSGEAHLEQPVVAGSVMSLLGGLVPSSASGVDQTRWYFLYWVVLITVLLAATVWCTAHLVPGNVQAATQVALSPVIVTAAVLSSDALAVALVAGAMLAWARARNTITGVLLGVGTMTRGYVALVAIALLITAIRSDALAAARRVCLTALATACGIAAVFAVVQHSALTAVYTGWWGAKASYGSPWLLPQLVACNVPACTTQQTESKLISWIFNLRAVELPVWTVTTLAILGIVLALVLGRIFAREAYHAPTWPQVAFVVVAMAMMTGKAVPVQASLWLLPLAAAAGVRWRDHLIWAGTEIAHFIAIWLYIGALTRPDRALPGPWYGLFLVIRLGGISWMVSRVWRAAQYPSGRHEAAHARGPAARDAIPA
ncbi:MAG: hypothetical protein LKG20_00615 [Tetrasphaera jenkinsii]|jgi:hypothetical protein|nr:hypothetical protein [Tetrasphaera jenkinsii]